MARIHRAPQPTPEFLQERAKRKAEERLANSATPAPGKNKGPHECAGQRYKVASHRVVHGARKGEVVSLCPHAGATKALVQSGHLVLVTVNSAAKSADTKGADNG